MTDIDFSKPPTTVGELRRRLQAMGNPWTVSSWLNDDDQLPQPPRGGQHTKPGHVEGLRPIHDSTDFKAVVHVEPPANPFLGQRWVELGLLPADKSSVAFTMSAADQPKTEWGGA
jgi:hypothetical protein